MRLGRLFWTLALALGAATPALAGSKEECVRAVERGQDLRDRGQLLAARTQFIACAKASCPAPVRRQCTTWLTDIELQIPTMVVAVRDEAGRDIVDVRVSLDGKLVATRLDGLPLSVDPGAHLLRFEPAGSPPVELNVLLRTGEKNRPVDVTLATPPPETRVESPAVPAPEPEPESETPLDPGVTPASIPADVSPEAVQAAPGPPARVEVPWLPVAFGIVAVGCAALFGGFGYSASHDVDRMRAHCAPDCSPGQVDAARHKEIAANVFAALGVLAAGAGVYFWVVPLGREPAPDAAPVAAPALGVTVGLSTTF